MTDEARMERGELVVVRHTPPKCQQCLKRPVSLTVTRLLIGNITPVTEHYCTRCYRRKMGTTWWKRLWVPWLA